MHSRLGLYFRDPASVSAPATIRLLVQNAETSGLYLRPEFCFSLAAVFGFTALVSTVTWAKEATTGTATVAQPAG